MSEDNGAVEGGESGEAAEGLAQAVYLQNDYSGAAERYEHAFAAYRRAGDALGAARCARMLAWIHGNVLGDWAVQSGWTRRACTELAKADEDSAERGWIELLDAHTEAEPETQVVRYRRALELGRRHGDPNLEFEALGWLGVTEVIAGRLEGLPTLDEALTAVCAGEVDDIYVIEGSFCGMLWACEMAHDVGRARQWMRALEDLRLRRSLPAMASFCRAHYGSILTAAGRWDEAERELVHAARPFQQTDTRMTTSALVRLAQLRILQGRYEEAEQLLEGLDPYAEALYPKAALLLSQGRSQLARAAIDRALAGPIDTSADAPLLALLVEAALATDDIDDAHRAADRLGALAQANGGSYMNAVAALARGSVDLAKGSLDARGRLEEALRGFAEAEMPLETARARLGLAHCLATERPEVAVAEAKSALDAFDRLQAARYADEAAALLRSLGAPGRVGPKGKEALTKRETEVLKLLGHGLSNPEISDRLYISRKTVEHHVGNVLAKLGLRSRAEAAAYAARSQIEKTSP